MSSAKAATSGQTLSLAACIAIVLYAPVSGLAQGGLSPILPQLTEHFAHEPNSGILVRLMVSGLGAAMIVGALVAAFLADRVNHLRLLLVVLAIYTVSGIAGFFIEDLYLLVVSRIVLGVATAAGGAIAMGILVTRLADNQRDRWIGFVGVGGTMGSVVAVIVVGALAAIDWRYAFLPYLIAIPLALLFIAVLPNGKTEASAQAVAAEPGGTPWAMIAFGLIFGAASSAAAMYVPFHLASIGLNRPEQVATAMAISVAVGGATSFAFGWVRQRFSAVQTFHISLSLVAAGMTVMGFAADQTVLLIGMSIFGAGIGLLGPNYFSACAAATPVERRARMMGQIRGGFYAGPLIAQLFLEVAMRQAGSSAAILGIAVIAVLGIVLVAVSPRTFAPIP